MSGGRFGAIQRLAVGYRDPDGNPPWVEPVLGAGFMALLVACVVGCFWFRSKTR